MNNIQFVAKVKLTFLSLADAGGLAIPAYGIDVMTYSTQGELETALRGTILGPGISINSVTYNGALSAAGTFQNGFASGIGISRGIVLTSGDARLLNNGDRNMSPDATGGEPGVGNNLPGKPYLDALNAGFETYDATEVTITFTTTGGNLYFNYVFGSEEYNEYANMAYNDVFGFFIDGIAVANNLALLPGTTTPVSVNNVNLVNNPGYYIQNRSGDSIDPVYIEGTPSIYGIEYDGFTHVLTASALGLSAGEHTITLAIADAGDYILDSGVFIQAASFSSTQQPYDEREDNSHNHVPDPGSTMVFLTMAASALMALKKKVAR